MGELNVLVVEDEFVNAHFLSEVLKSKCKSLKLLENGALAVDYVKENDDIDIVLMDIRMPVMDGYEAARQIKAIRPDLPIIAQSAYAEDEDVFDDNEELFDAHISKPIRRDLLYSLIESLCA